VTSKRVAGVEGSSTLTTIDAVKTLRRRGVDVFGFSVRPEPLAAAVAAARNALGEPWAAFYTDSAGMPELREALGERASANLSRPIDSEHEVLVSVGAKSAIFCCLLATIDPGDEVVILDPAWVSYEPCIRLAGGRAVHVPLEYREDGFRLRVDDVASHLTPRTRLIILNSPHNPTGVVLDQACLQELAQLAIAEDLTILSDECYEAFVFDGNEHVPIARLPDMFERTVTVSTSSKLFNTFGWRVGWAVGPRQLIEPMLQAHQNIVGCAPSHSQAGVIAAVHAEHTVVEELLPLFESSREILLEFLNDTPGVSCHKPQGAYFLFPNITQIGVDDRHLALTLLHEFGIHVNGGSDFGTSGAGFLRLSFACTPEHARAGGAKLQRALSRVA
jgi:aspartate/methionine/tyrosine aminotransferase